MKRQKAKSKEVGIMKSYKITHLGAPYAEPHIGRLLAKKLDAHRWHVLRIQFADEPQAETYEAVLAAKTVTPNAMKKLMAKAWARVRSCGLTGRTESWSKRALRASIS